MEYPEGFDAKVHSRKPICGVLSVALCAGVSYPVAHASCKTAMLALRLGMRFRGRTYHKQREYALSRLAVRFTRLSGLGIEGVGIGRAISDFTLEEFCEHVADDGFTYMISVSGKNKTESGHCFTLKDGLLIDQYGCKSWAKSTRQKNKLCMVTRIDGKGW